MRKWVVHEMYCNLSNAWSFTINNDVKSRMTRQISIQIVKIYRDLESLISSVNDLQKSIELIGGDAVEGVINVERHYDVCIIRFRRYDEIINSCKRELVGPSDALLIFPELKSMISRLTSQGSKLSRMYGLKRNIIMHERSHSIQLGSVAMILDLIDESRSSEVSMHFGFDSKQDLIRQVVNKAISEYNLIREHVNIIVGEFNSLCDHMMFEINHIEGG